MKRQKTKKSNAKAERYFVVSIEDSQLMYVKDKRYIDLSPIDWVKEVLKGSTAYYRDYLFTDADIAKFGLTKEIKVDGTITDLEKAQKG